MEEQEIIESNKLIAEFMVGKPIIQNSGVYVNRKVFIVSGRDYLTDRLEYHSSWDWLIPIVEKINKICSERGQPLSNESRKQEHLSDPLYNPLHWKSWSYHHINLSTDIQRVYIDVTKFIKWYNKQNKK